jgi:putative Ca2+/H+ antiporter (TMEM165/GDT1 family)
MLIPFFVSTGVVTLSEIGDKTQLLAFILATKFKNPKPIIAGILVATLINHGFAGAIGAWLTSLTTPSTMSLILGITFIAMAIWIMIPDKYTDEDEKFVKMGVFGTTVVTFFLAEMGDKTQIATIALAANYHTLIPVVAGTTLGMLIADVPAVFLGNKAAEKFPLHIVRSVAAVVFVLLGLISFANAYDPNLLNLF